MRTISKNQNDLHRYDDLVKCSRPASANHPKMSAYQRAAQFAPFDALSGYREFIKESARLTKQKIEISEEEAEMIDRVLQKIQRDIQKHPIVNVTYFKEDEKKEGGSYFQVQKCVKKIENGYLYFVDHSSILLDDILQIETEKTSQ